jgi:hypothetical protein
MYCRQFRAETYEGDVLFKIFFYSLFQFRQQMWLPRHIAPPPDVLGRQAAGSGRNCCSFTAAERVI